MELTMIDFMLILGFLVIAALIIAYFGLSVDVKEIDPIDSKVFDDKKSKRKRIDKA